MRRSTTLLCARYWSDTLYSSEHLPAASRSRAPTSVLLLLHNALADAQHLLDLEARHRLLRRTRPSSSPRSQPRVVLASRGVLALRGRAAGTARALAHTGIPQRQPRERPESRGCHGKLRNLARFGLMTTELAGITFSFEAGFAQQTPGFSHSPRYTYGLCVCTRTKREFFFLALWSHTSHVHGPRPRRNWARVSAATVCHRGILLWYFLMRGLLRVPNLMGLGTTAQCEVPLKRKRLSATLVGLSV